MTALQWFVIQSDGRGVCDRRKDSSDAGYALLEILAALFILGVAGYASLSSRHPATMSNLSAMAVQEASLILTESYNLSMDTLATANVTPLIVNDGNAPSNMLACNPSVPSGDLCGPFPGSYFVVTQGTGVPEYTITLAGTMTASECADVVEASEAYGSWVTVNGLSVSSITPATAIGSCGGGTVVWTAN